MATVAGAVIAVAGACGNAKITRFDAAPRHVCPGDPVQLAWAFQGSGTMTIAPAIAHGPSGRVDRDGKAVIRPVTRTTVGLDVTRTGGESTGMRLDIEMAQGEAVAASIADPGAACRDGRVVSTAHVRNFASDLAVSVIGVRPGDARAGYDVTHVDPRTHQAVTAHVAPGSPTPRFSGMPLVGDWILSSPLSPGESCDPPRLPSNLIVVAYTHCGGGGGQP
jgi:hypothetical protein